MDAYPMLTVDQNKIMTRLILALATGLMIALLGCQKHEPVSKPETFAPPPDAASQKGDMAPGPP